MLELAPAGFEEVDAADAVHLVAYGDGAFEERLRAAFGAVHSSEVAPGWEERWRAFHRPVRAGGLWIGPPWESPPRGELAVVIDPGAAFGTGAHPTTRACVELLAEAERGGVLDAGCGSGVLAVSAALLGFLPVVAVDSDPLAVAAACENAARNHADVEVRELDILDDDLPVADVVVANVELGMVERLLRRLPGGMAIVSGYLAGDEVRAPGWRQVARMELEGWAADSLIRS